MYTVTVDVAAKVSLKLDLLGWVVIRLNFVKR